MNVVDKVKMYEQNKAQKIEQKSNNSNYLQQFKQEKKNLTSQQKKNLHSFKKQFSLLKEPVILNVMKKHEFNSNIVEPELKMMYQNQQFSQSQNWIGDKQNKNHKNQNKNKIKNNFPQKKYENNYQGNHQQNHNDQYHHKKQYNNSNQNYQTKRFNKNYQNGNNNYYQKNYHKNYNQNKYQGGQQMHNQKYQQFNQNGQYKQRSYNNNYNKQYKNNYQNKNFHPQKNGYHKKKYEFEYVKQNGTQKNHEEKVKENQIEIEKNDFERISEQIDESNTYSEEHTSDIQESQKIHSVIQRLDTILGDKMKQSYKQLQVFAKALETEQSQLKKNFDKKKYIKKGIDIKKEFIIEPDESSSHFVKHKVNVILQNKRFESEEEKLKTVREKQLETQIGEMQEDMKLMKRQIDSLRNQVEELKRLNRSKKTKGRIDYCIVPVDVAEKYFNLKDKKKNFSLFGLSQDEEEDEIDEIEDQLMFLRLQKNQ